MKTLKKVALVVIACLCVIACFIGCADQVNRVTAGTYAYYGDFTFENYDKLELKVKFKSAYATPWGTNFYSKSTIPELKEQIDKQKQKDYSLETTRYGERYLLIDKTKNGHVYHYLVVRREQTESGGWRYDFMDLEDGIAVDNLDIYVGWLVPYHLFGDVAYEELLYSGGGCFEFEANHTYPSEHGIDDFYDFYKVVESYTMSREKNVLALQTTLSNGEKIAVSIRFDETESGTTVTYFNSVFVE
ncbi:MAG: hypothetical protein K2N84_05340 [Clostridia bacterium]|nr:hypothetical protein [Clostridia bacterium]